jgi:hypothetical protein
MSEGSQLEEGMPRVSRNAMRVRRGVSAVCAGALFMQVTACYTAVPVQATGAPIRGLSTITVNDRGRLLVGAKLGSLLDRMDGRITGADSTSVQITVGSVWDVRGGMVNWGGEPVSVPREGIAQITQRRVEKTGTSLILGGIVAGLIGLYAALRHNGSGGGPDGGGGPGRPPIYRGFPAVQVK